MRRRIHVLHLIQGLEVGGLEKVALNLAAGLDQTRFRSSICCYDSLGPLAERCGEEIRVHLLKRRVGVDYTYPIRLARLLRRERVDVLHLHNATAFFYGVFAGRLAGTRAIVFTEHDREFPSKHGLRIVHRILGLLTSRTIVVAKYLRRNLWIYEGFNPAGVRVIYNGVSSNGFCGPTDTAGLRDELRILPSSRVIGIVGRLDPIKNHKCLFDAMKDVVAQMPGAMLLVVGDGPLRKDLERIVEDLGLREHVRFLGTRDDVPALLSLMELFVLCSHSEGLSLTLLEAQAAGKPIVATDVGGNGEVVVDRVNGILVPPNDSGALARALLELLNDSAYAHKLGAEGRKQFERLFNLDNMISSYEELYEDSLESASTGL